MTISHQMASTQRKRRTDVTTIQIDRSTRLQLDRLGDIHRESYNDIILRLVHFYNENNKKLEEMVEVELPADIIRKLQKANPRIITMLSDTQIKPVLMLTR